MRPSRARRSLLILTLNTTVAAGACLRTRPGSPGQESLLAFTNATVIDAQQGARSDMTVLVRGDRISAVGSTRAVAIPADARRIDAAGLYLLPGFWDMHVHLTDAAAWAPELFVAWGVTGVRDMGGDYERLRALRDSIRQGTRVGPRMRLAGPFIDGPKNAPHRVTVRTADDARQAVTQLAASGVDFIKIHNAVPRDAYFAVLETARAARIAVAGHVPMSVSPSEASDAGQSSLEHVATIFEGTFIAAHPDVQDQLTAGRAFIASGADTLADRFVKNGTWFTPTLYPYRLRVRRADPPADAIAYAERFVPRAQLQQWQQFLGSSPQDRNPMVIDARRVFHEQTSRMVGVFQQRGVRMLAATDVAGPYVMPGSSLHEELAELVAAGLTPLQALGAATLAPAQYLEAADSLGTIAVGRAADLVLLEADPLADITNTRRIRGVVLRGRWYDRAALDALLAELAARARAAN